MNTCKNQGALQHRSSTNSKPFTKPQYQAQKNDQGYDLRVYVPGTDKSSIVLSLDKDVLTIEANRANQVGEDWRIVNRELPVDDYRLRLQVDTKIDPEGITAKLDNGVLAVSLPLKEAAKPHVIEVS